MQQHFSNNFQFLEQIFIDFFFPLSFSGFLYVFKVGFFLVLVSFFFDTALLNSMS